MPACRFASARKSKCRQAQADTSSGRYLRRSRFLKALGEKQKPVSVKLMDGQTVRGWIEYYDKNMVRLTREGAPNLFIFKHEIMYIAEDGGKRKWTAASGFRCSAPKHSCCCTDNP